MTTETPRRLLERMFLAAIDASLPARKLAAHLPPVPIGRTVVIGAGKAAAAMAAALEAAWPGPLTGLVVTRYGHATACRSISVVEAGHPVPDAAGLDAAQRMMQLVEGLGRDDLVICLMSGGASALLPLPLDGVTLADKQALNRALLDSGASITEMNCVRRHLSAIKGGRLARACHPAPVWNLLISDVPGDDPIDIGSGPTVPDPTTCADALAILARYGIALSPALQAALASDAAESVKQDDAMLPSIHVEWLATPRQALDAAAKVGLAAGYAVHVLGDAIEGEARDVGKVMAGIALSVARHGQPFVPPCILLSGGETTVTVRGEGRGGRNVEFLLSLALALRGVPGVYAMAGDTDGIDGQEDVAGAVITPDTLSRAWCAGMHAREALDGNDAHRVFEALGDALRTGATQTNVNDFRAILVANTSGDNS